MTDPATTCAWDGSTLQLAVRGRATGAAVRRMRTALEEALAAGEPFAVLFDRRHMTALTADGRSELERWGEELTPRLPEGCVAWADLFDQRRYAAMARAASAARATEEPPPGYPQESFDDPERARAWLARPHPHPTPRAQETP